MNGTDILKHLIHLIFSVTGKKKTYIITLLIFYSTSILKNCAVMHLFSGFFDEQKVQKSSIYLK